MTKQIEFVYARAQKRLNLYRRTL